MSDNVLRGCLAMGRKHTETTLQSERAVYAANPNGTMKTSTLTRSLMPVLRGININSPVYFCWSSMILGERLPVRHARQGKAKPTNGQACQVFMPITSDRRGSDYAATESDGLGA